MPVHGVALVVCPGMGLVLGMTTQAGCSLCVLLPVSLRWAPGSAVVILDDGLGNPMMIILSRRLTILSPSGGIEACLSLIVSCRLAQITGSWSQESLFHFTPRRIPFIRFDSSWLVSDLRLVQDYVSAVRDHLDTLGDLAGDDVESA